MFKYKSQEHRIKTLIINEKYKSLTAKRSKITIVTSSDLMSY